MAIHESLQSWLSALGHVLYNIMGHPAPALTSQTSIVRKYETIVSHDVVLAHEFMTRKGSG